MEEKAIQIDGISYLIRGEKVRLLEQWLKDNCCGAAAVGTHDGYTKEVDAVRRANQERDQEPYCPPSLLENNLKELLGYIERNERLERSDDYGKLVAEIVPRQGAQETPCNHDTQHCCDYTAAMLTDWQPHRGLMHRICGHCLREITGNREQESCSREES